MSQDPNRISSSTADEDHLLRLIGKAVSRLWPSLPPLVQEAILNQAETNSYRQDVSEVRERLKAYLEP